MYTATLQCTLINVSQSSKLSERLATLTIALRLTLTRTVFVLEEIDFFLIIFHHLRFGKNEHFSDPTLL